jgi:hypothetical protein
MRYQFKGSQLFSISWPSADDQLTRCWREIQLEFPTCTNTDSRTVTVSNDFNNYRQCRLFVVLQIPIKEWLLWNYVDNCRQCRLFVVLFYTSSRPTAVRSSCPPGQHTWSRPWLVKVCKNKVTEDEFFLLCSSFHSSHGTLGGQRHGSLTLYRTGDS